MGMFWTFSWSHASYDGSVLGRSAILTLVLCASSGILSAQADAAIHQAMRVAAPRANRIQLLHRSSVDPEFDLVVALTVPKGWEPAPRHMGYWVGGSALGLFLQRRSDPGLAYKHALENASPSQEC